MPPAVSSVGQMDLLLHPTDFGLGSGLFYPMEGGWTRQKIMFLEGSLELQVWL